MRACGADLCVHYGNNRAAEPDGSVATCMRSSLRRLADQRARETISKRVNWSRNAATGENQEINHIACNGRRVALCMLAIRMRAHAAVSHKFQEKTTRAPT